MKTLSAVLVLWVLCAVTGCNKDPDSQTITRNNPLVEDFKKAYLFDTGSYWVYHDSVNTNFDSMVLDKVAYTTITTLNGPGGTREANVYDLYMLSYRHPASGSSYNEQLMVSFITLNQFNGPYLFISGPAGYKHENAECAALLDSLQVGSRVFRQVVKMKLEKAYGISNNMNLYYVQGIGVVRKEILDDSFNITNTLNLERWHTVMHP